MLLTKEFLVIYPHHPAGIVLPLLETLIGMKGISIRLILGTILNFKKYDLDKENWFLLCD